MNETLIHLENIRKSYQLGEETLEVLRGINLKIHKGDFVSIMGQSGSGKSTLMNIIGMLDTPTSGRYHFKGNDVSGLSPDEQSIMRRNNIGFIFQSYNLIPRIAVIDQVMLPLVYQGVGISERKDRAHEALKKVGLSNKVNSLPNEMSGGQQQRVAVARAIVTNPVFIFGDEPTGALDSKTGKEVMELISILHAEGKTVLIITHSAEVDAFAKKHIFMKDGLIEEKGTRGKEKIEK